MATSTQVYQFEWRNDVAADWAADDPVLGVGEPGYEIDTERFKVGNGRKRWSQLQYYTPGTGSGSTGGVSDAALLAHINNNRPHPVYDDLPSLTLLFENGLT